MTSPVMLTLNFATLEDAARFFGNLAVSASAPAHGSSGASQSTPTMPQPQAAATPAIPSQMPMEYPQVQPAQPVNGASPSNGAGMNVTVQQVQPVMQQFINKFGPNAMKAAFDKHGLPPQLSKLDQNGLNTLYYYTKQSVDSGQVA